jgi:hypothetical protein
MKKKENGSEAYRELKSKLISSLIKPYTAQEPEARPYLDGAEREAPPAVEAERARARRRRPPRDPCGGGRGRPERRGCCCCCLHGLIRCLDDTNRIRGTLGDGIGDLSLQWLVVDRGFNDEVKGMNERGF